MSSATYSPLKKLTDACFPEYFQHFNLLATLLTPDSDSVPCLERLAALRIVETAVSDPLKQKELLEVFEPNAIESYLPILFGSCPALTRFVIANISIGSQITFFLGEQYAFLDAGVGERIVRMFRPGCFPIDKVYEILTLLLERNAPRIVFLVGFGQTEQRSEAISRKLVDFVKDFGSRIARRTKGKYRFEAFIPNVPISRFSIALAPFQ